MVKYPKILIPPLIELKWGCITDKKSVRRVDKPLMVSLTIRPLNCHKSVPELVIVGFGKRENLFLTTNLSLSGYYFYPVMYVCM